MKESIKHFKKLVEIPEIGTCVLKNWEQSDIKQIYNELEVHNWAPWLAANPSSLAGRVQVFSEGQILLKSPTHFPIASLSTNKIFWDGNSEALPTWNEVAGDPTTYEKTYIDNGNTVVLMSMNVHSEYRKQGLARIIIDSLKGMKEELHVEHIIGSFRPNEYGLYKSKYGDPGFPEYCAMNNSEGLPIDAWLRSLTRNGMKPLKVDYHAMTVPVSIQEFEELRQSYHPNLWHEVQSDIFECGEVGRWYVDRKNMIATYVESNLWGQLV